MSKPKGLSHSAMYRLYICTAKDTGNLPLVLIILLNFVTVSILII